MEANGIAVDASGNAYVTGFTCFNEFPHDDQTRCKDNFATNSGFSFIFNANAFVAEICRRWHESGLFVFFGGTNYDCG